MNRVIHFEIQAEDTARAAKFYKDVFDWKIEKWPLPEEEYFMLMTADKDSKEMGINGGLLKRTAKAPEKESGANAFVCTVAVENFDETEKKIIKAGGRVTIPKYKLLGMGMAWQGYFFDTEGNTFGVHESDESAQ